MHQIYAVSTHALIYRYDRISQVTTLSTINKNSDVDSSVLCPSIA